jgi:hypothetical protein
MFGWFTPSCPVALRDKVWVEQRLQWLFERFDNRRILDAPRVLPTREFFPDPYAGTADDLPALFARVCQYMGTDANRFRLNLFTENDREGALGLYHQPRGEQPHVWLLQSLLPDQEAVIATLAHEVAHDLLLGAGLVSGDEADHEHLSDLLPVVLGMGTFHANTAVKDKTERTGNVSVWQISRSGYLTAALCGYAMGVIEYLRQSKAAPSIKYLGADAAGAMRAGHKYLLKTNDCLVDVDRPSRPLSRLSAEALDFGASGSASRCMYVLGTWLNDDEIKAAQVEAALIALQHKETAIQTTAIEILAKVQPAPEHVIEAVLAKLLSPHHLVREQATIAAGAFQLPYGYVTKVGEPLAETLLALTKDPHTETAVAAAVVLGSYGSQAIGAVPHILPLLVTALIRHSDSVDSLIDCLHQIVGNVQLYLEENPGLVSGGHYELVRDHLRAKRPHRSVELRPKRK